MAQPARPLMLDEHHGSEALPEQSQSMRPNEGMSICASDRHCHGSIEHMHVTMNRNQSKWLFHVRLVTTSAIERQRTRKLVLLVLHLLDELLCLKFQFGCLSLGFLGLYPVP